MAKPKFDYKSNEFYDELFALAFQGLTDAEIADGLSDRFGQTLTPEVFSRMKNGKYERWSEKQNEEFGTRIAQVLSRARRKINSIVRGAYLKSALGGKKIKSKSTTSRKIKLSDGTLTDEEGIYTTENEQELAPNIQALSTWLYHHDEEWRKVERKEEEENIPTDINQGISIHEWIKDRIK